jgi:uncharacterized membrane protein
MDNEKGETSTGLKPNVAGLLCYVLGWVTGLVFFLLEKENKFVRFHAMQSIATFGAITVVNIILYILGMIPYIGLLFWIIQILVYLLTIVLWIILMVKAYQGQAYKLPWAGNFAEKQVG